VGLGPAVGYGTNPIIGTKIGGNTISKIFGMTLACFLIGLIIFFIELGSGVNYLSRDGVITFLMSFIAGIAWFFGGYMQFESYKYNLVSKSVPLSSAIQLIVVTLFGAFIFKGTGN
jgi:glucose uptake protein